MRARHASVAVAAAALLAAAPPVHAQRAQPAFESCTYDTCALRVEPRSILFGNPAVLRGADGRRVARFGVLGPDLERVVAGSDSAVAHARAFRPHARRAGIAGAVTGLATLAVAVLSLTNEEGANDNAVFALGIGSAVVGAYAGIEARLAAREIARSVWWYNRALPR